MLPFILLPTQNYSFSYEETFKLSFNSRFRMANTQIVFALFDGVNTYSGSFNLFDEGMGYQDEELYLGIAIFKILILSYTHQEKKFLIKSPPTLEPTLSLSSELCVHQKRPRRALNSDLPLNSTSCQILQPPTEV